MDISAITQLIGSLGFPIVMCFFLMKTNKEQMEEHRNEVHELRKTVENNTDAINKMILKMEVGNANRD